MHRHQVPCLAATHTDVAPAASITVPGSHHTSGHLAQDCSTIALLFDKATTLRAEIIAEFPYTKKEIKSGRQIEETEEKMSQRKEQDKKSQQKT